MAAQRLGQVLRHPPLEVLRRHDELRRHLRHQGRDGQLLCERPDVESHGDFERNSVVISGKPECRRVRSEADQGRAQLVLAGLDAGQHVPPLPVRSRRVDETAAGRGQHDRGPGQGERLRVGHRAGNRDAAPQLRGAGSGEREDAEQHGRQPRARTGGTHHGITSNGARERCAVGARNPRSTQAPGDAPIDTGTLHGTERASGRSGARRG